MSNKKNRKLLISKVDKFLFSIILLIFLTSIIVACNNSLSKNNSKIIVEEKSTNEPTKEPDNFEIETNEQQNVQYEQEVKDEPYNQNIQQPKEASQDDVKEILAKNLKTQSSTKQQNIAPKILITEPDNDEIVTGNIFTIWWKAQDENNDELLLTLNLYSDSKGWYLLSDNEPNDRSYDLDISSFKAGNYQVKITATDGLLESSDTKKFTIQK